MIFKKIQKTLSDIMGIQEEEITLESHLYDELDVDSLDLSQMILELENTYSIEIDNEDMDELEKVSDIVQYIKSKL